MKASIRSIKTIKCRLGHRFFTCMDKGIDSSHACSILKQRRSVLNLFYFCYFNNFPIVIFMVGLWGLIPDIIHFLGWLPKEITRTHLFDVFFLHTTFEYIENTMPVIDSYLNFTGQLLLAVVCIGTMIFYVGQVKKAVLTSAKNSKEG